MCMLYMVILTILDTPLIPTRGDYTPLPPPPIGNATWTPYYDSCGYEMYMPDPNPVVLPDGFRGGRNRAKPGCCGPQYNMKPELPLNTYVGLCVMCTVRDMRIPPLTVHFPPQNTPPTTHTAIGSVSRIPTNTVPIPMHPLAPPSTPSQQYPPLPLYPLPPPPLLTTVQQLDRPAAVAAQPTWHHACSSSVR